jgi:hypothetical protein
LLRPLHGHIIVLKRVSIGAVTKPRFLGNSHPKILAKSRSQRKFSKLHPKNLAETSSAKILIFSGSDLVNELYAVSNGSAKADLADQI